MLRHWKTLALLIVVANFAVYAIVMTLIGGNAVYGHRQGDHFYLSEHGRLTEVGAGLFTYSLWHSYLTLGLWFIGFGVAAWAQWQKFRSRPRPRSPY